MNEPWLVGIEIGGTKLQVGLGRRRGEIEALERWGVDPSRGAEGVRERIREAFHALLAGRSLAPGDVRGVGIGFGGPVDAGRGRTKQSFQIDGWAEFHHARAVITTQLQARCSGSCDGDFIRQRQGSRQGDGFWRVIEKIHGPAGAVGKGDGVGSREQTSSLQRLSQGACPTVGRVRDQEVRCSD